MDRLLAVGAIIESKAPAKWINDLLHRLKVDTTFQLTVVQQEPANSSDAPAAPLGFAGKLAHHVLVNYIDKPLFPEDPRVAQPVQVGEVEHSTAALSACDVILNLTGTCTRERWPGVENVPIWSAHIQTLDARVEQALLDRAPLVWVHLWMDSGSGQQATRIASHALPRQSFSLSDLQHMAYFCLPSLFESRLHWLASQANLVMQETGCRSDMAANVVQERDDIEQQASRLAENHFKPRPLNQYALLVKVMQLMWQQSLSRIAHRLWYEQWQLASFIHEPSSLSVVEKMTQTPVDQFNALPTPDRTWWADPHLYEHEQSVYIFFEEMQINSSRGHLSVARLHSDGQISEIHPVVNEQTHLSYPFVFSHDSQIYMVPETAAQRKITLYKAHQFPDGWEPDTDLIEDVDLADTTVHFRDGYWWMFTNSQSHRTVNERDELRIYYASELHGPWTPHCMNPVITGVDRARMAGPLFVDDDQLYRPSQYGAHRYGYGINLNRVDTLTTTAYIETPVARILPEPGTPWLGCHSISHLNGVTVLDRVTRRRRF